MAFTPDLRFSYYERYESRDTTLEYRSGTHFRRYVVSCQGYTDTPDIAESIAINTIKYYEPADLYFPDTVTGKADYVFSNRKFSLRNVQCKGGDRTWYCDVSYEVVGRKDTYDENFQMTGETSTLYDALASTEHWMDRQEGSCLEMSAEAGETGNKFGKQINVNDDGLAEGIEIISPYGIYTRRYLLSKSSFADYNCWVRERQALYGSINDAPFGAWCRGELRFERLDIDETVDDSVAVTFAFGVRPGRIASFQFSDCNNGSGSGGLKTMEVEKLGWEYIWTKHKQVTKPGTIDNLGSESASATQKILGKEVDRVVVQQLYPFADFDYIVSTTTLGCDPCSSGS